eukprot:TRINITY_DN2171_c0_g2_i2.p1 TRINITY_DN2171_c0_g2~~TRINITY_DN2171_c0_g2_i2.p1  ORF type:complete len:605 (+),score=323.33 TRINITY_DN2171_c0_g2_i2:132-1946(+)
MGCGPSLVLAKDGTIAPGKGEADISVSRDFKADVMWAWTDPNCKKVTVQIKAIPEDIKKIRETKWVDHASGPAGIHVASVRPTLQQQRWVVEMEDGPVNMHFPGEKVPDFCKKIHGLHQKDETKFPMVMTKAASKKEGHSYNSNPDKAKTDCDNLAKLVNPAQMSDDMEPLKTALVGIEDMLPGNNGTLIARIDKGYGTYATGPEGPPELTIIEKGLMKKDEAMIDPTKATKVLDGKERVMRQATTTIMMGLCKALGMTQEQLLPDLPGYLDMANGKKPFCVTPYDKLAKYVAHVGEGYQMPTGDAAEAKRKEQVLFLLEQDKKVESQKKEEDKDTEGLRKRAIDRLQASIDYCRDCTTGAPESALTKGTRVVARWKKFGWYEGVLETGVLTGVIHEETGEQGKYCQVRFDDTDVDNVAIDSIALEKSDPAPVEELVNGAKVRARFYGDMFMDGVIVGFPNPDGTYKVAFDILYTQEDVKAKDIRRPFDLSLINKEGHLIPKTFYDVQFTWVQEQEDLDVKLRLWREGDEANVQEHSMKKFENNKRNPDLTESKEKCHGGYRVKVPVWRDRSYCYNFKVGEEYFVNFKKPVEQNGYRTFALRLS